VLFEKEIKNLVNAIQRTDEFSEYKKAKSDIEKYKDLKEEVELFQKNQIKLYNMNMQDEEAKSLALELNRSFNKLSKIPEVNKLIRCGKEFNDMILTLYRSINDLLDSEFDK